MKRGILRIAALTVLLLAISISMIYAEEVGSEYVDYDVYVDNDIETGDAESGFEQTIQEPAWRSFTANVVSDQVFNFRIEGGATINYVNEHGWFWLVPPWLLLDLERRGIDTSYFRNLEEAMSSIPQLEYLFSTWNWGPEIIALLDMPTLHISANAFARVEFDFFAESLMVLSWGGDAQVEMGRTEAGVIASGAIVTLPGNRSLTAIYVHVSYGHVPLQYGHILLLVEVPSNDGRRVPAYSFNPEDHIPSDFAAHSIYRARELGILPDFLDHSFRRPLNRLEFAYFAVYLHEAVTQREIAGRTHFNDTTDINAGKMGFLGVMTENEVGGFSPLRQVTRDQAALLLVRLATVSGLNMPLAHSSFADAELVSYWAQEAAMQVVNAGIMTAPNGYFEPGRVLTREEMIVMMVRLFDMI